MAFNPLQSILGTAKKIATKGVVAVKQTGVDYSNLARNTGSNLKEIAQGTTRSLGSLGMTLTGQIGQLGTRSKGAQILYGKTPVKDISTRIAEGETLVKQSPLAKKLGVDKYATPLSFLGVGGTIALDVIPGGAAEKNAIKQIAKSKDTGFIKSLLKKLNVADDIAESYAPRLATISDENKVVGALDNIKKLQNNTKQTVGTKTIPTLRNDFQTQIADNVGRELSNLKSNDFVSKGKDIDLNTFGRLDELQKNVNKRALTQAENREAVGLLRNIGKEVVPKASQEMREFMDITKTAVKNSPIPLRGNAGKFKGSRSNLQGGFINPGKIVDDIKPGFDNFKTQFIDKYDPIRMLTKGKNIAVDSDPYVAARLYAGHTGKIENRLDDLSNILTPAKKDLSLIKEYGKYERFLEQADNGITKFEGGLTPEQILEKKNEIVRRVGPDKINQIQATLNQTYKYQDGLLQELYEAGIFSKEDVDNIRKKGQKYLPLQRAGYIADQGDSLPRGSNSFSVPTQNIIKRAKGSEREVIDPLESIVRNTHKTVALIERNKVAQKVAALATDPQFKDIVFEIDGVVPAGFEKMSVFIDGIKREFAVPKDVGEALKGMNAENVDLVTKWARLSSSMLRAGATSLNVGFLLPNALRDAQTAFIVSKVGFYPQDWVRGFASALGSIGIGKGDLYKKFLETGGSSGYFESQKSIAKSVRRLTQSKGVTIAKTILNPIELINTIGQVVELTPRLGVYGRSLRKDLSGTEAAFNARNSTVDFAKSGNTMKVVNMWVPFLNARTQGTVNMFNAIRKNPVASTFKLSALIGVPIVATYLNNTKYHEEIWNDISQQDKDNNFIIIYGDERDEKGNPTQTVKIPKGDIKTFANPLETYIDYMRGKESKSAQDLFTQTMGNISPVDFQKEGDFSLTTLAGSILPPTIKGVVESGTNTNLYTGRDIVPQDMKDVSPEQQYNERSSIPAKVVGKVTGTSPMKIDNFIKTQFGTVGRQVTKPSEIPGTITGRFNQVYGGEQEARIQKEAKEYITEQADKRVDTERIANGVFVDIKDFSIENKKKLIRQQSPEVIAKIKELFEEEKLGVTYTEKIIKKLGVENGARARYIATQVKKMKTPEEKKAYLKNLIEKKVASDQVVEQIKEILSKD